MSGGISGFFRNLFSSTPDRKEVESPTASTKAALQTESSSSSGKEERPVAVDDSKDTIQEYQFEVGSPLQTLWHQYEEVSDFVHTHPTSRTHRPEPARFPNPLR